MCIHVHKPIQAHQNMSTCMCIHLYVYMHTEMHAYMHKHIHMMHTHASTSATDLYTYRHIITNSWMCAQVHKIHKQAHTHRVFPQRSRKLVPERRLQCGRLLLDEELSFLLSIDFSELDTKDMAGTSSSSSVSSRTPLHLYPGANITGCTAIAQKLGGSNSGWHAALWLPLLGGLVKAPECPVQS